MRGEEIIGDFGPAPAPNLPNTVADIHARFKHNASYAIGSRLGEKLFSKREVRKLMLTVAEECAKCMCGTAVETSH